MKPFNNLIVLLFLSSCALSQQIEKFNTTNTTTVVPEKKYERRVEYIIDIDSSALNSYKKTNLWLAKKLNNSKYAVQVQDEKEFLIASKMSTSCNTVNSSIDMDFDFRAKEKKIKIVFENIKALQDKGNIFSGLMEPYPSSESQLADFKKNCLDEIILDLKKNAEQKSDW